MLLRESQEAEQKENLSEKKKVPYLVLKKGADLVDEFLLGLKYWVGSWEKKKGSE